MLGLTAKKKKGKGGRGEKERQRVKVVEKKTPGVCRS